MDLARLAQQHAAVGDVTRLSIVEQLLRSDRSPSELAEILDLPTNLLAHHLGVLEEAGLVHRTRSEGDGRRRYLTIVPTVAARLGLTTAPEPGRVLFVCTHNSARSQLAAALWEQATGRPTASAGTHPADAIHPEAFAAAERAGLEISAKGPRSLADIEDPMDLVITVCDRAHEELEPAADWWHWSTPDPVGAGSADAFDATVRSLANRIHTLTGGNPWN
jgi:protein-tyrosine-phosphatase